MASPFHLFRRNQKLMLAILTLMAMFAFVFLDPLFRYLGSNQAPVNPVVAETKYGDLKRSDIEHLEGTRRLVEIFLKKLAVKTVEKMNDQGLLDLRSPGLREYYSQLFQNQFLGRVMRSPNPTRTQEVVDTMLLARRAEAMNVTVSDATINALFEQLTNNAVTFPEITKIINELGGGASGRITDAQLFEALRTELLASSVAQSFAISINATPPGESWDFYKRLNQKATIEAVAVRAAKFADKVPDPSEDELTAFFDKHKDQFAIPGSPEPGFKQPRRQKFEYFLAEYDLMREKETVTDEEIKKYYDENKEQFRKLELPKDEPSKETDEPSGTEEEKPAIDGEKATGKVPDEAVEQTPASEESESKTPASELPEATPAEETPEADPPKNDDVPKPDGAAEYRPRERSRVKFRLVSDEKSAPADPKSDAAPADETPTAETADQPATPEKTSDDKPADEKPADDKSAAEKSDDDKPPVEPVYQPLEEVSEQIKLELQGQKARKKIGEALQDLQSRLGSYAEARTAYDARKELDPSLKPPKELDFVALAKQYGFKFEETKLVSYFELNSSKGLGASRNGNQPFAFLVFRGMTLSPYNPVLSEDADGNAYLSWAVQEEAEAVPNLADVRDQVLETWKLIKARDLARKQAETYAAEVTGAKKKLSEVFSGDKSPKVIAAGPFSWLTLGTTADNAAGGVPMLSEVPGIDSPSTEFMQTTFGLAEGEVGVAMNGPKDTFYVVQVIQYEPPTKQLEEDFAHENFRNYLNVAVREKQQLMRSWMASVEQDAGLKWIEEPAADE